MIVVERPSKLLLRVIRDQRRASPVLLQTKKCCPSCEWACGRCRETTPFQSPAWLIAWSKHLARGELLVLSFTREENLVGIAPFHILVDRTETKQVLLLGTGISDYLDIITAPGYEPHVVSAL